jgi:hypothetical protein
MNHRADTVFINGSVITIDPEDRICEAVAVAGNRILFVGNSGEALTLAGSKTVVLDLKGRSLMPGFVDAHCHPGTYGVIKFQVPCGPNELNSIEELKQAVSRKAVETSPGEWILGRGYNHLALKEKRHPTRWDLDAAAPDHKVFLVRTCGHIAVANSRVLEACGIGKNTPDPEGGKIDRDEQGEPTGILYEQAAMAIRMRTLPSAVDLEKGLMVTNRDFLSLGITSLHDANGINPEEIRVFQKGVAEGWLQIRLYLMVRSSGVDNQLGDLYLQTGLVTGFGNERIRLGPYKLMLDGAGSGASAAMRAHYPGDPNNFGILHLTQKELDAKITKAHRAGYQIAVHAIGDRAIEMALASFGRVLAAYPRADHRHRIEHCGFLDQAHIKKISDLEIVPVLGVPFLYELGDTYLEIFGEKRLETIYPLRSLLAKGVKSALSSDAPVIQPNPMHGLYAAVVHRTKSGRPIAPREKVDLLQAIRAYTLYGAYASFEEQSKGSLETGKLSDLIVLSQNILEIPPEELLNVTVDLTMIDGKIVYQKEE